MIHLDNAATSSLKPEPVLNALDAFIRSSAASTGRSGHRRAAEGRIEEIRGRIVQIRNGGARVSAGLTSRDLLRRQWPRPSTGWAGPGDTLIKSQALIQFHTESSC
jgi:selenocysteine lyase/cysteine desulfurase